jgi:hypothetical protein
MRKRLKTFSGLTAALVALALGGSAVASAAHHGSKRVAQEATAPDTDSIQAGDQTSPDTLGAKASSASESSEEPSATETDGPGGHEDPEGDVEFESEAAE